MTVRRSLPLITGGGVVAGASFQGSAVLWVDGSRTDTYTPTGTIFTPFKTIQAAINQVAANGDNSANKQYVIMINPGVYPENLLFESTALSHIILNATGHRNFLSNNTPVILTGTGVGNIIQSNANNANVNASFQGMQINPSVGQTISGVGCPSLSFINCTFDGNVTVSMNNVGNFNLVSCSGFMQSGTLAGSTTCFVSLNSQPDAGTPSAWTLTGTAFMQVDSGSLLSNDVTVNSGCTLRVFNAQTSSSSTIDVKSGGTFQARASDIGGTLTAEAGSTCTLRMSRVGTFTGTVLATGTTGTANLMVTAAAPTVAAAQVGIGNGKAATASAGAGAAPPATVDSYLIINDGGTVKKIPLYLT